MEVRNCIIFILYYKVLTMQCSTYWTPRVLAYLSDDDAAVREMVSRIEYNTLFINLHGCRPYQ